MGGLSGQREMRRMLGGGGKFSRGEGGGVGALRRSPPNPCNSRTSPPVPAGDLVTVGGCEWNWGGQSVRLDSFRGGHIGPPLLCVRHFDRGHKSMRLKGGGKLKSEAI